MKTKARITPQTTAVLQAARKMGHASNHQILVELRSQFPFLTATTVHRITNRLIATGLLANGPEVNGVQLVDANTLEHDHFMCSGCDGIKDVYLTDKLRSDIKKELKIKKLPSRLTIYGGCETCY
ncbi:transcriptional repressor [Candidatus Saccharibacteria bacterium]|jgi:Fe2+ or Zn2+ uptake regulation protein|nr:transcriptional repressor [Candidatus Saccharibacteria bacterium]